MKRRDQKDREKEIETEKALEGVAVIDKRRHRSVRSYTFDTCAQASPRHGHHITSAAHTRSAQESDVGWKILHAFTAV